MDHDAWESLARARDEGAAAVCAEAVGAMRKVLTVQLHGGMGMAEELAIGHYFKRLTAMQYEFGSIDRHRTRYAQLTRG